jgi:hypothetical protein
VIAARSGSAREAAGGPCERVLAVTCAAAEAVKLRIGAELRERAAAVAEAETALAAAEAAAEAGDKSSAAVCLSVCAGGVCLVCLRAYVRYCMRHRPQAEAAASGRPQKPGCRWP